MLGHVCQGCVVSEICVGTHTSVRDVLKCAICNTCIASYRIVSYRLVQGVVLTQNGLTPSLFPLFVCLFLFILFFLLCVDKICIYKK